jgi:hypothetical protein
MLTSGELERIRIRQRNEIRILDFTVCHYCKSTGLKETDIYCPNCGFPQHGTQGQMKKFLWNISNKKKLLEEQKGAVRKARNVLYILAAFNFVGGIGLGLVNGIKPVVILAGVLAGGVYFALGLWSKKQPFAALLSGFFVYIVFTVITAINDPSTIYKGSIFKIFFIAAFVYGYRGAKDSKKLEAELQSIRKAKDLNGENDLPKL